MYKQMLINAKLQIGKRGQKIYLTGKSQLRRQRSILDSSAIEEEEDVLVYRIYLAIQLCKYEPYQVLGDVLSVC